jgi:hypothetical protein
LSDHPPAPRAPPSTKERRSWALSISTREAAMVVPP